ncbi:sodium-dependent glucose transporter 1B-like [Littorina saxatilis]|uniref:sodium-dependent glucose transporter 1B-like n=1 Tax=Littorina saxatilis TaxID=31220 RepID=UPI0038B4B71A
MGDGERSDGVGNRSEAVEHCKEDGGGDVDPPDPKASIKEKLKQPDYRSKVWRTVWLGAAFWALGFAIGQRGPAFLDIQIITQTDVEAASFFFTSSSVGYLVGSLVAGVVYDKLNKSLLLLVCVLGMGVTTVALPWCAIYAMMIFIQFMVSLFGGGLDTVGNAELVRIWGKEGETAMQTIHFAFAFGGIIGPLATEPFLTPTPEGSLDLTSTAAPSLYNSTLSMLNSTVTAESSNVTTNSTVPAAPVTTIVHYAYLISGSIILLIVLPFVVQLCTDRSEKRRQDHTDEKKSVTKQPLPTGVFIFVLFTFCCFYFLYCSVEDTFAAYLSTFVVKHLHWSKTEAAQLTSAFWASFAIGRFFGIFVVQVLSSVKLLFLLGLSLAVSLFSFLWFSQEGVGLGVWICTVVVGASMSAIFPTGFSWMEEKFLRVTGRVASSILIASSSGTMANPIVLGYLMQELTPMWFSYLLFGEAVLCFCIFLFLLVLSRFYIQKHYSVNRESKSLEIAIPTLNNEENI